MEQRGIKESLEFLEGVKVVGVDGKKIMADGKVNLADAPAGMHLLNSFGTILEAVKGADQIPAEAKDLSGEELQQLGAKVLEVVNAIRAA